jgi:hypothetical protein
MAVRPDDERKERVLHTRVPPSLDRHLKHRARRLGMSVSTVVRHVLLNTFGLVEDIVNDTTNVALALTGGDSREPSVAGNLPSRTAEPGIGAARGEVLAWQEAVLNLNAICARCNAVLHKGVRAALGIREAAGPPVVVCQRCLERHEREPTRLPLGTGRR